MRKVVYFHGGTVADFEIPDALFEDFTLRAKWEKRHSQDSLLKARQILEAFMRRAAQGKASRVEPGETVAACFVWNYFNTHPDEGSHIAGDVVIVDLQGDGSAVEYAAVDDVQMVQEG